MNRDTRSDEEILSWLQSEYDYPFEGWDFSYVSDTRRLMRGFDFWDYPTIAASAAGRSQTVLEQGTGGGERFGKILEAAAFTGRAYGTEGYAPNVLKARERLSAFNVEVIDVSEDADRRWDDRSCVEPSQWIPVQRTSTATATWRCGRNTAGRWFD